MRRAPLYSAAPPRAEPPAPLAADLPAQAAPGAAARPRFARRHAQALAVTAALIGVALAVALLRLVPLGARALTQNDIDRAVFHTLDTKPLPSPAAKAFDAIRGSVVKVIGVHDAVAGNGAAAKTEKSDKVAKDSARNGPRTAPPRVERDGDDPENEERGIGTGVVIIDNGTILTNLHVVQGARSIKVVFADGLEAEADLIGVRPEHDLAVLRARQIPDDLHAATMRSTGDLRPGDRVTAVGFPFGIGPSVSHGVVSGLKREFRSPQGQRVLTNLIQFDAAANPGNSGGPLVTDSGEVVGIVTAIFNPTEQRFFVGIGFAVPIENAAQAAGLPPF